MHRGESLLFVGVVEQQTWILLSLPLVGFCGRERMSGPLKEGLGGRGGERLPNDPPRI